MQAIWGHWQRADESLEKLSHSWEPKPELSNDNHEAGSVHPGQEDHHREPKVQQG